jgi:hypothetical protein
MNERHDPPAHPYKLTHFTELGVILIGPDNRCACSVSDWCPLRRTGMQERCTVEELKALSWEAMCRRSWQSQGDYD